MRIGLPGKEASSVTLVTSLASSKSSQEWERVLAEEVARDAAFEAGGKRKGQERGKLSWELCGIKLPLLTRREDSVFLPAGRDEAVQEPRSPPL